MAGASLIGAVLISNAAFAQQGCCEGGSATGANAWTTGNTTDQTPANIAGATAPTSGEQLFHANSRQPGAGRSSSGAGQRQFIAGQGATCDRTLAVVVDPR